MKLLIKKFIIIIVFLNLLIVLPSCGYHVEYDDFFGIGSFGPLEQYGSYVVSLREDGYYQIIKVTETQNDGVVVIPQYINGIPVYGIGVYHYQTPYIIFKSTFKLFDMIKRKGYYMNLKDDPQFIDYIYLMPTQRIKDYLKDDYDVTTKAPIMPYCEIIKSDKIYIASKTGIDGKSIDFRDTDVVLNYSPVFYTYCLDTYINPLSSADCYPIIAGSFLYFRSESVAEIDDVDLVRQIMKERKNLLIETLGEVEQYFLRMDYFGYKTNTYTINPLLYEMVNNYNEIMLDTYIEKYASEMIKTMDKLDLPYTDEEVASFKINLYNHFQYITRCFDTRTPVEKCNLANILFKYNLTIDGKKYTNPNMSADFAFDITEYDTNRTISYVNEGDIIDYLKGIEIDDYWIDYSDYRTRVFEPPVPYVEGYEFQGWYKESECINKWDFQNDIFDPAEDLILYAKWQ